MDQRLLNVGTLGLGFMFVFTSFLTVSNIEKMVLKNIQEDHPSFTGDGYVSLCIIYGVFAICNWIAPAIISAFGSRASIFMGSLCYVLFLVPFLWPSNLLLYTMSVMLGFGASIIWTGQGTYLTLNSDSSTISRNSGIFWAMSKISYGHYRLEYYCSTIYNYGLEKLIDLCIGNVFIIVVLRDNRKLDEPTRIFVFVILAIVGFLGSMLLMVLRPSVDTNGKENELKQLTTTENPTKEQIKASFKLLMTRDMSLLTMVFLFIGLHVSLYSGVYCSCISFTKSFGANSAQLLGYAAVMIGVGEVAGGLLCSIFGEKSTDPGSKSKGFSRSTIIVMSFFVNIVAYSLMFINLPNDSPFGETLAVSWIEPNHKLAVLCAFLLGLGDSGFTIQIYNIIGVKYSDTSASATSLFMFIQAVSAAVSFFYSNLFGLHVQLGILVISMMVGTLSFIIADKSGLVKSYPEFV